ALDHGLAAIGLLDRAHLGGGNIDDTHQRFPGDLLEEVKASTNCRRLQHNAAPPMVSSRMGWTACKP
ncbi:hypothetical protein, partial [Bradyrhizobium ottawaense]|uniref:hypothetical protein n=1 Tax=Bradyrhizobium ottawaense TaxID=931866 RepID=UPI0030C6CED9